VRNLQATQGPGGTELRCGLCFNDLPQAGVSLVQRYISRLERERIARA